VPSILKWTLSVTVATVARPCALLARAPCATFSIAKIVSPPSWGFLEQFLLSQQATQHPHLRFCRPGLGAVYNGEYNKALIHVVVFVALIVGASSDIDTGLMVILILASIGFCFYMAIDAMRVAKAKNLGENPSDALDSWTRNRPVGPILLIGLGILFLLNNFDWFSFHRVERFLWPLILIGVGLMLFRNRLGNRS
jgi:hypothetical protein